MFIINLEWVRFFTTEFQYCVSIFQEWHPQYACFSNWKVFANDLKSHIRIKYRKNNLTKTMYVS